MPIQAYIPVRYIIYIYFFFLYFSLLLLLFRLLLFFFFFFARFVAFYTLAQLKEICARHRIMCVYKFLTVIVRYTFFSFSMATKKDFPHYARTYFLLFYKFIDPTEDECYLFVYTSTVKKIGRLLLI